MGHLRSTMVLATLVAAFSAWPGQAAAKPRLRASVGPVPPEHLADPALRTYNFRVGPYRIGGYETLRHTNDVQPPPVEGSIVGMDVRVVDADGRPVSQARLMLHHILFTNGGPHGRRRDGTCPDRPVNERFYGTSEELRAMTLPAGYGYPTQPRDRWKMIWMLMNHRWRPRVAFVEYRVTVDPSPSVIPVKPYWVSVVPCVSDPQYSVPGDGGAGATSTRTQLITIPAAGRIVAIGAHLHGGSRALDLRQPRCGDRPLFTARPTYGMASDPLYKVKPLLHEPDPKNVEWWQSATGWPVDAGEELRVSASYDNAVPHSRVMGIAHVYVAPPGGDVSDCGTSPADPQVLGPPFQGRRDPPHVALRLATVRGNGRAVGILRPGGRTRVLEGSGRVVVKDFGYRPPNLSIPRGATVRWVFKDKVKHDATLVSGPRGFATPTVFGGRSFARRFDVPGLYRLHCSIHPVDLSATIRVRRAPAAPR